MQYFTKFCKVREIILIKIKLKEKNTRTNIGEDNISKYYPEKNSDITLSFNADISYGEEIEKIIINGTEANIVKNVNNENKYELKIRVGNQSGVQLYNIEKVILKNQREIKVKETVKIDVLKAKPEIKGIPIRKEKNKNTPPHTLHMLW